MQTSAPIFRFTTITTAAYTTIPIVHRSAKYSTINIEYVQVREKIMICTVSLATRVRRICGIGSHGKSKQHDALRKRAISRWCTLVKHRTHT